MYLSWIINICVWWCVLLTHSCLMFFYGTPANNEHKEELLQKKRLQNLIMVFTVFYHIPLDMQNKLIQHNELDLA